MNLVINYGKGFLKIRFTQRQRHLFAQSGKSRKIRNQGSCNLFCQVKRRLRSLRVKDRQDSFDVNSERIKAAKNFNDNMQSLVDKSDDLDSISISGSGMKEVTIAKKKKVS